MSAKPKHGFKNRYFKTGCLSLLAAVLLISSCGRSAPSAAEPEETTTIAQSSTTTTAVVVTQAPTTIQTFTGSEPTYIVAPGDAFSVIAGRFGVSAEKLAEFNAIADPDLIKVGQTIYLPEGSSTVTTAAPTTTTTTVPEEEDTFVTAPADDS